MTLFKQVRGSLNGDIVFGNLEAPLIEEGTARKCGQETERKTSVMNSVFLQGTPRILLKTALTP